TSTSVASLPNPSTYGQPVTFSAVVTQSSGAIVPTGNVILKDGSTSLATITLINGQAAFITAKLSGGAHSITALYIGNTDFSGSTSPALTQTVNQVATSASVTSSLNPSTYGQAVTFTVTVTPSTGTAVPNGTVTFMDGTTTLGTKTLSSGKAAFATTSLAIGAHLITAVYGGGTNFNGSTSP